MEKTERLSAPAKSSVDAVSMGRTLSLATTDDILWMDAVAKPNACSPDEQRYSPASVKSMSHCPLYMCRMRVAATGGMEIEKPSCIVCGRMAWNPRMLPTAENQSVKGLPWDAAKTSRCCQTSQRAQSMPVSPTVKCSCKPVICTGSMLVSVYVCVALSVTGTIPRTTTGTSCSLSNSSE